MKLLRRGVIILVVGLLALCAACEVFCQATLRPPRRFPTVPILSLAGEEPAWRTVMIPARDHARLEASFVAPKEHSTKCVLMVHGIADSRDGMTGFVPLFTSHGYRVLLPDGRAHGNSGGDLITYGLLEKYDAIDWAHWLRSEGCQTIYGFGESLGAAILIQSSAVDPIFRSIVAECSYADMRGVGKYRVQRLAHLPAWLAKPLAEIMVESALLYARVRFGVDLRHASPVADIACTRTPILLIHGLADERTPAWNSELLAKANPRAVLWLVPGAGHMGASRTQPEEFNRRVLEWFGGM